MSEEFSLEIVEEYELLGQRRFRVRVKGTSLYVNVAAESREEALEKARRMIKDLELDKVVKEVLSSNNQG